MADTEIATVVENEIDWAAALASPLYAFQVAALSINLNPKKIGFIVDKNQFKRPMPYNAANYPLFAKHYKIMESFFPCTHNILYLGNQYDGVKHNALDYLLGKAVHIHYWMEESLKRRYPDLNNFPEGMTAHAKLIFEDHCKYTPTYKNRSL